jgi:YegS/Rv2252/BmrU family lipid kinase
VKAATIIDTIHRRFDSSQWQLEIHETASDEPVGEIVRSAVDSGIDGVYAVGGDGTISAVVDGLANTPVPLGIIPAGTTNVVAQELGIPLNIDKACQVLAGKPEAVSVDAIRVGDKFFVLAVGTGIDALVMDAVSSQGKRRYGRLAYAWSTLKIVAGMQPRRFTIIADGKPFQTRAAVVLISNVGTLTKPLRWGPDIRPDDGRIDINIIRGRNILDYLLAAYDVLPGGPRRTVHIRHLPAYESVSIESDQKLLVQGDGDLIGETPLNAFVVPGAVRVLVPGTD